MRSEHRHPHSPPATHTTAASSRAFKTSRATEPLPYTPDIPRRHHRQSSAPRQPSQADTGLSVCGRHRTHTNARARACALLCSLHCAHCAPDWITYLFRLPPSESPDAAECSQRLHRRHRLETHSLASPHWGGCILPPPVLRYPSLSLVLPLAFSRSPPCFLSRAQIAATRDACACSAQACAVD